jgi:hypothetical protein
MSRDIYVQDLPPGIHDVTEISSDFRPKPLSVTYDEIVRTIRQIVPTADFADPEWGVVEGKGYSIEVSLKRETPVRHFALHCRAAGREADVIVAEILEALDLRALDPDNDTGIFQDPATRWHKPPP